MKYSKNVDIEILKYKDRELRTETERKPTVNGVTELQRTASLLGSVHVHLYIQPMSFTLLNLSAPRITAYVLYVNLYIVMFLAQINNILV